MSEISASRNASDIGLIVQGILIFLSAVIGVVGYYVQGRLKSKEKKEGMCSNSVTPFTQSRSLSLQVYFSLSHTRILKFGSANYRPPLF